MKLPAQQQLENIYGEAVKSGERFEKLAACFSRKYQHDTAEFFTAPGRTEIIGNHTDHNGGLVLAASIDMDTIGAAWPNDSNVIRITSEGYYREIMIDLNDVSSTPKSQGTVSLVAGMVEALTKFGFKVSGFDAYVSTNVIAAAGVSSSASFEMLICAMVNTFFNDGIMTVSDYARIGQYAENVYWEKASGMMDQMACAFGGVVRFDFSKEGEPSCNPIPFAFSDIGHQLVIVNTGKGHADLSAEYSAVPFEMAEAARAMGVKRLCESDVDNLMDHIDEISNDRAILRAIHFYDENERVQRMVQAIEDSDGNEILHLIDASGHSSWELLQNCYSLQNCKEQKVSLTLALTRRFLEKIGAGVCRVHGGGFAGVIACILPEDKTEDYVAYIAKYVGKDNVYPMHIRPVGAVCIH